MFVAVDGEILFIAAGFYGLTINHCVLLVCYDSIGIFFMFWTSLSCFCTVVFPWVKKWYKYDLWWNLIWILHTIIEDRVRLLIVYNWLPDWVYKHEYNVRSIKGLTNFFGPLRLNKFDFVSNLLNNYILTRSYGLNMSELACKVIHIL